MKPDCLTFARRPSPIGMMLLVIDSHNRLCALDFEDYQPRMMRLLKRYHGGGPLIEGVVPPDTDALLTAYFAGQLNALDELVCFTGGTPFQQSVWTALRHIPPATTVSYGALAAQLGRPTATRAVGLANGANPVAIVIPCHRVIGADGSLTGYGGGLPRKQWLLEHEGALCRSLSSRDR